MTSIATHDNLEAKHSIPGASITTHVLPVLDAPLGPAFPLSQEPGVSPETSSRDLSRLNGRTEEEVVRSDDLTEQTLDEIPPTPPLTRSENPHGEADEALDEELGPVEVDATEWHPLEHTRRDSKDPNQTQDTTFVDDSLVLDPDEKYLPVAAPRSRASNQSLRIVPKAASPQPWDMVDPGSNSNGTDFYSTLGTKNFGTMQKNSRSRPPIPHSSYYFGPPPVDSAYGTNPIGHIGIHHPREVFRIERDYTGGELVQFAATYPLELEGRITPTQFLETINAINELLISAHSIRHSFIHNVLAVFTLQISQLFLTSHYEKEMQRLELLVKDLNTKLYNPVGLNILWPRKVAFLFLEIEYY